MHTKRRFFVEIRIENVFETRNISSFDRTRLEVYHNREYENRLSDFVSSTYRWYRFVFLDVPFARLNSRFVRIV